MHNSMWALLIFKMEEFILKFFFLSFQLRVDFGIVDEWETWNECCPNVNWNVFVSGENYFIRKNALARNVLNKLVIILWCLENVFREF